MKKDTDNRSRRPYGSPRLRSQVIEFGVFGCYNGGTDNGKHGHDDLNPGAERSWWWGS